MSWRALSRSVIGTYHQRHHLPCQDVGAYRIYGNLVVGVIADGSGSAKRSEIGATLAVSSALEGLINLKTWLEPNPDQPTWPTLEQPPSQAQTQRLFERVTTKVRTTLQQTAEQHGHDVEELASTLLAFAATPHWISAMQIGDGLMVVRTGDDIHTLLFQPDKGEFVNQTAFVTDRTAVADMQVRTISQSPQFICAATDAFERLAIQIKDWTPHPPFFKPLEEYLWETPTPEQDDAYIVNFLDCEYLNQQTDDDKTLLLCRYFSD